MSRKVEARTAQVLRAGGMVPLTAAAPDDEVVDVVVARGYRQPVLGDRVVVRLCSETLVSGDDLEMEVLGFGRGEDRGKVGQERRRPLGFPGWPLVHDPKRARLALEVVGELKKQLRRARSKPGHAKEGIDAIGERLGKSVPHFLPSFYEEAGRAFAHLGNLTYAATMFGKAREAEHVHALAIDEQGRVDSFLEFALAGAVTTKALTTYAKALAVDHEPPRAYQLFRKLCVQRTLGGMPPWSGMAKELRRLAKAAKLDVDAEDVAFIADVVDSPALARAAADFWRSYADAIGALAARSPRVRGTLLGLFPTPSGESDAFDDEWLALLERTGATRALFDDDEPEEARPAMSRAAWFDKLLAHTSRRWRVRNPPEAIFGLLRRMAPRLIAERNPLACVRKWNTIDLDVAELALELGIPIAPASPARVDLGQWADEAKLPQRGRDPVRAAAHPALAALVIASVATEIGDEPFDSIARGKQGFLAAKRAWLEGLLADAERGGLPAVETLLAAVQTKIRPSTFAELPDLHARLAALAIAPAVARTFRGGLIDELGWPVLEAAIDELDPDGKATPLVSGAFPVVVVSNRARAIAVGPTGRLGTHDLRVPTGTQVHACRWVAGQFLVILSQHNKLRAYWSSDPNDVFESDQWMFTTPVLSTHAATLPDGRVFSGGVALGAGDRKLPEEHANVSCDGHTGWRSEWKHGDLVLREVSPRTGDLGRVSWPGFLEANATDGKRIAPHLSYVLPAPDGLDSPLGQADGMIGACVRHGGTRQRAVDWELITVDGGRWSGLAAGAVPSGLLRLPGDDARRPIVHVSEYRSQGGARIVEPGGTYVASQVSVTERDYARGQAAVLDPLLWHLLTPRDAAGSTALRQVTDDDARALIDTAMANDANAVERGLGATGLRAVTDRRLARGIVGVLALAARCEQARRTLVAERHPTRAAAAPPPTLDDDLLIQALAGVREQRYSYGDDGSVTAQIHRTGELFGADDRSDRVVNDVPATKIAWPELLCDPGALAFLAQAFGLTEAARREVACLLRAIAGSDLAGLRPMRVFDGTGRLPFKMTGAAAVVWRHGNGYLLRNRSSPGQVIHVLEYAASGSFKPLDGLTCDAERQVPPIDAARMVAWCDALDRRDAPPWSVDAARALSSRTGLSMAEATLLWAGCPNLGDYSANFLAKELRDRLELKSAAAATARDTLRSVRASERRGILSVAGDVLLQTPDAAWAPLGSGPSDDRNVVAALAAAWNQRVGRRTPVPDDLLVAASRDVTAQMEPGPALAMIANPDQAPELTVDGHWTLGPDGALSAADEDQRAFRPQTLTAASYLPYLFAARPVGDPLRANLPRAHARYLERLANPTLLLDAGHMYPAGRPDEHEQAIARFLDALGGDELPKPLVGRRVRGALVHRNGRLPHLTLWLVPSELADERSLTRVAPLVSSFHAYGRDASALLRLIHSAALARMMARVTDTPVPAGAWEQDPSKSAPELVARAQAKLKVSGESATLYLQLLSLFMPTPKQVQAWNGWTAGVYKKAITELVDKELVLEAKRERAQRAHFLPGGWEALKAPHPPMETWKLALFGAGEPPLGRYLVLEPFHELFARAWQRIEDGDTPRYEEAKGGKR